MNKRATSNASYPHNSLWNYLKAAIDERKLITKKAKEVVVQFRRPFQLGNKKIHVTYTLYIASKGQLIYHSCKLTGYKLSKSNYPTWNVLFIGPEITK